MIVTTELLDDVEHVAAKPTLVGGGVARLVDAAVDPAPEMLNEGAEQPPIDAADGEVSVEYDLGLPHRAASSTKAFVKACDAAPSLAMGDWTAENLNLARPLAVGLDHAGSTPVC